MNELSLKNEEAQFRALQKQSIDLAEQCNKIVVNDPTTLSIATQNLSMVNDMINRLEKIRKDLKQPYWDAGVAVDNLAKPLKKPLEEALANGKAKILAYEREQRLKAEAEEKRISFIKNQISEWSTCAMRELNSATTLEELDLYYVTWVKNFPGKEMWFEFNDDAQATRANLRLYASQRKIQITNPDQSDDDTGELIKEAIAEEIAVIDTTVNHESIKGIRETWKFELVDKSSVPFEWLMIDEKAVKEWIKENKDQLKDGHTIGGVRFFIEQSLTIR